MMVQCGMKKLPSYLQFLQQSILSFVGLYDLKNVIDGSQCELVKNLKHRGFDTCIFAIV